MCNLVIACKRLISNKRLELRVDCVVNHYWLRILWSRSEGTLVIISVAWTSTAGDRQQFIQCQDSWKGLKSDCIWPLIPIQRSCIVCCRLCCLSCIILMIFSARNNEVRRHRWISCSSITSKWGLEVYLSCECLFAFWNFMRVDACGMPRSCLRFLLRRKFVSVLSHAKF